MLSRGWGGEGPHLLQSAECRSKPTAWLPGHHLFARQTVGVFEFFHVKNVYSMWKVDAGVNQCVYSLLPHRSIDN